jgi:hypothetical protein
MRYMNGGLRLCRWGSCWKGKKNCRYNAFFLFINLPLVRRGVRLNLANKKTHPPVYSETLAGRQPLLLQREGAKNLEKISPSLFKRGIFPEGMAYAKGEFVYQADY